MVGFQSFRPSLLPLLEKIVARPELHARFLNTLSYLENCGARKIAACEHPTMVKEEMLKHAAEEFRHAHHLKKEMSKLISFKDYSLSSILGGTDALFYLSRLDLNISRYLKKTCCFTGAQFKEYAYLLVTYAIEKRAEELYPLYHQILKKYNIPIRIQSIIKEEKGHLAEITQELNKIGCKATYKDAILAIEANLFALLLSVMNCAISSNP